jgi:hypothetical protein
VDEVVLGRWDSSHSFVLPSFDFLTLIFSSIGAITAALFMPTAIAFSVSSIFQSPWTVAGVALQNRSGLIIFTLGRRTHWRILLIEIVVIWSSLLTDGPGGSWSQWGCVRCGPSVQGSNSEVRPQQLSQAAGIRKRQKEQW